jgi:hypothetical protein
MKTIMELVPDIGIPYEPALKYVDLLERAKAACNTAQSLTQYGAQFPPDADDKKAAATMAGTYASDPEAVSKAISSAKASTFTPASMILTASILEEFKARIVTESVHIRNLVTNKLLLETESGDARIRLKACELLGKISDVGLFVDKSEVVHKHESTEELRTQLKEKLVRLIDPTDVISQQ